LNDIGILSVKERAAFLLDTFRRKRKGILEAPDWSETELSEMGKVMKAFIKSKQLERRLLRARIDHLELMSRVGVESPRDYWLNLNP
jgi:hypothetical protein